MKGFIDFLKAVIASNVFTAISILGPILFVIIWTLLKKSLEFKLQGFLHTSFECCIAPKN